MSEPGPLPVTVAPSGVWKPRGSATVSLLDGDGMMEAPFRDRVWIGYFEDGALGPLEDAFWWGVDPEAPWAS